MPICYVRLFLEKQGLFFIFEAIHGASYSLRIPAVRSAVCKVRARSREYHRVNIQRESYPKVANGDILVERKYVYTSHTYLTEHVIQHTYNFHDTYIVCVVRFQVMSTFNPRGIPHSVFYRTDRNEMRY